MFVCCVLSGRGLRVELITRLEESYRLWCVVVCDLENLKNEEAMTRVGSQRHSKKYTLVLRSTVTGNELLFLSCLSLSEITNHGTFKFLKISFRTLAHSSRSHAFHSTKSHFYTIAYKSGYTLVTLPRTVTPYRDSVDGSRDRVTYQKLVTR